MNNTLCHWTTTFSRWRTRW